MPDLLEDPDGAPYPQEVQALADRLRGRGSEDVLPELVAALESVADWHAPIELTVTGAPSALGMVEQVEHQQAVHGVERAWNDAGIRPRFHARMQGLLRKEWPTLADALDRL